MSTRSFTSMLMGLLLVVAGTVGCEGEDELLGLAGAETAIAQETGEGPEGHLARLQERLELTAAQLAEIRAILEDQREKLRALGESAPEDREARREAFREIREETRDRIGAVLTEEQRQRLERMMRTHARSHGPRGGWHEED